MTGLVERLYGPHEWGYRDPVEGGFIEDGTPFEAADALSRATDEEGLARVLHEAEGRITGYDVPWDAEVESERQQTVSIARAIIAHIKGEKKDD